MSKMITQIKNQNMIRCRAIYYIKLWRWTNGWNRHVYFFEEKMTSLTLSLTLFSPIQNSIFPLRNPFPTKTKELLNVLLFI